MNEIFFDASMALVFEACLGILECKAIFNQNLILFMIIDNFEYNKLVLYLPGGNYDTLRNQFVPPELLGGPLKAPVVPLSPKLWKKGLFYQYCYL